MAYITKLKAVKTRSLIEIVEILKGRMCAEADVVWEEKHMDQNFVVLCFEQYYYRCKNYVALTAIISEKDDNQEAVLVGSGGGNLWDISLGAEKSFVKKSEKILKEYGFEI